MAKEKRRQPENKLPARYGRTTGPEFNSGIPIEMPLGACRPQSLSEIVAKMVHHAVRQEEALEAETWDEANDFEMDDDMDMLDFSKYELKDMDEEYAETAPEPPQEAIEANLREDITPPPKEPPEQKGDASQAPD